MCFVYVCVLDNVIVFGVSAAVGLWLSLGLGWWWHDHELCECSGSGGVRDERFVYEHGSDREHDEGGGNGLRLAEGARVLVRPGAG